MERQLSHWKAERMTPTKFKALRFSVAYTENGYNVNTEVFNRLVPTE
jgi:hypothetical protein